MKFKLFWTHLFFLFSSTTLAESLLQKEVTLALNWKPEPQFGGFIAAGEKSARSIYKIKILPGGSGTPTIQMLTAGKVDYAIVSADEIILSHDRGGKDVVALFAAFQTNPQMIMAHAQNKYGSLSELFKDSEATLLWQKGLPYAQYLTKKLGPLKAKEAPFSGGIGAFQAQKKIAQQGFVISEPLLAKAQGLEAKVFLIADEGYNPYTTVLVTQKSRLKKSPEEVKVIAKLIRDGWSDYLKNPEPTNQLILKLNPAMNPLGLKAMAEAQIPLIETEFTRKASVGKMTPERWAALVDQLYDLKIIKNKPAPTDLFTDL